jgi:2-haloacid dehalogenase
MADIKAVVFDLYGTLFDVHSVVGRCDTVFPSRGREISLMWRQKQLEYSWLRTLMGQYIPFEDATADALRYTCRHLGLGLDDAQARDLCDEYLRIRPFPEVPAVLRALNERGLPLAILTNGSVHSMTSVVQQAGLRGEFAHLISVEKVRLFKPHTQVYELSERAFGLSRSELLFVSSNAWDASGARHFGHPVCWVNRSGSGFEELGQRPDHIIESLEGLPSLLHG